METRQKELLKYYPPNLPKNNMNLSVVIPIYNEELAIGNNTNEILSVLRASGKSFEIVLVNDGSTDKTLEIIQNLAQKEPELKIVSYSKNRGRGYALRQGFAASSGECVVSTESDLNWGSDIILRLLNELENGDLDLVIASPHMKGGGMENVPVLRRALSFWGNKVFSLGFNVPITMATGMTRGYKREFLNKLDLKSDGKELHPEILYKALDLGAKVKEIPAILRWKKPAQGEIVRKSHFKWRTIASHLRLSAYLIKKKFFGRAPLKN